MDAEGGRMLVEVEQGRAPLFRREWKRLFVCGMVEEEKEEEEL